MGGWTENPSQTRTFFTSRSQAVSGDLFFLSAFAVQPIFCSAGCDGGVLLFLNTQLGVDRLVCHVKDVLLFLPFALMTRRSIPRLRSVIQRRPTFGMGEIRLPWLSRHYRAILMILHITLKWVLLENQALLSTLFSARKRHAISSASHEAMATYTTENTYD